MRPRPKKARRSYTYALDVTPPNISTPVLPHPASEEDPILDPDEDESPVDNSAPTNDTLSPFSSLPDELILKIAEFLDPLLIVEGRKLHSSAYKDPGYDLAALSNTCRYMKGLLESTREQTEGYSDKWRSAAYCRATNCRHSFLDITPSLHPIAERHVLDLLEYARHLKSFAVVYRAEEEVVAESPYNVELLGRNVLFYLRSSAVRSLFLCGVAIDMVAFPEEMDYHLETLIMRGVAGNPFELIARCTNLKRLELWRDFLVTPRFEAGFWPDHLWSTLEEIDLKGFSGERGRALFTAWTGSLQNLRSNSPNLNIPLRSLRMFEPFRLHAAQRLFATIKDLPHLTSFSIIIWKDSFGPSVVSEMAAALPLLEHLEIAVESESLFWWTSNLSKFAIAFGEFKHLKSLVWNHLAYQTLTIPPNSHQFKTAARSIAVHTPSLRKISWVNEDHHVVRDSEVEGWRWNESGSFAVISPEEISEEEKGKEKERRRSSGAGLLGMMREAGEVSEGKWRGERFVG